MLAAQLARRGIAARADRGRRPGRAAAPPFRPSEPAHLLNVRAEAMSAWPDEPDHFARTSQAATRAVLPSGALFGRYLRDDPRRSGRVGPGRARRRQGGRARRGVATAVVDRARRRHAIDAGALVAGARQPAARAARASPPRPGRGSINNPWSEEARGGDRRGGGERRRRAADRHRPDDGRRGAVARRGRASRHGSWRCRGAA